ncbi:MAG TPA: AsmA family protein, partial [Usitatibacter sp.]|nr:AsmA family protein [Usitatibacter sp.]
MKRLLWIAAVVVLLPVVLLGAIVLAVQSEFVERRVEQMVANKLNRDVEINGISLKPAWPPLITVAHLRISNPPWAREKDLVNADGLYARVAVPPLFRGLLVLPWLGASRA